MMVPLYFRQGGPRRKTPSLQGEKPLAACPESPTGMRRLEHTERRLCICMAS